MLRPVGPEPEIQRRSAGVYQAGQTRVLDKRDFYYYYESIL